MSKVIAVKPFCAFSGIVIFEVDNIDDQIEAASYWALVNGDIHFNNKTSNKLYYTMKGRAFFVKDGCRHYLDDFIKWKWNDENNKK